MDDRYPIVRALNAILYVICLAAVLLGLLVLILGFNKEIPFWPAIGATVGLVIYAVMLAAVAQLLEMLRDVAINSFEQLHYARISRPPESRGVRVHRSAQPRQSSDPFEGLEDRSKPSPDPFEGLEPSDEGIRPGRFEVVGVDSGMECSLVVAAASAAKAKAVAESRGMTVDRVRRVE
jgi:hypothetical protein